MKIVSPLLVVLLVLAAVAWWDDPVIDADVVIINRSDAFTLDPQRMSYLQDFRLAHALYEPLVRWNNNDLSIEPAAAELPHISSDGLTYTFSIFPSARWSNGDPVTAHDFVYAWSRLLWPDTAADYSNLFFVIDGAQEFFRWRAEQLAEFAKQKHAGQDAQALLDAAERRFAQTVGIQALDDRTLQVRLKQPTAYFLDLVCFPVAHPVHRPTVEGWPEAVTSQPAMRERGWIGVTPPPISQRRFISLDPNTGHLRQKHDWTRPGTLVSNGPYVLEQWRYKRDMRLVRNPHYHRPEIMRNESVAVITVPDANTAVMAFESGAADWLLDVGAEYVADMLQQRERYIQRHQETISQLLQDGMSFDDALALLPAPQSGERRNIHPRPTFGTDFYSFNCRPTLADGRANPFADARVRRAFALSVNKHAIVRDATRLNEPIANTLIPPGSIPGYESPQGLGYDLQRAKAELASAGWIDRDQDGLVENERGEPFPVVDLLWTTNAERYRWMSLALKAHWEQHLGVRVELRSADTKFYKEDLKLGKFMIARGRWYGDYGDPTTFLDINRTGDGNNDRGFSSKAFDQLLDEAAVERDPDARMKLLQEAERLLFEHELPLIPICQLVELYMYEPGAVRGVPHHPRLIQYLWQIQKKEKANPEVHHVQIMSLK